MAEFLSLLSDYDASLDHKPLVASRQSLALIGADGGHLFSLSFHFAVGMGLHGCRPVVVCPRSVVESKDLPKPIHPSSDEAGAEGEGRGGNFDFDALDRVDLKYLDTLDDVGWYLRSLHQASDERLPTCLVIESLESFLCTDQDKVAGLARILGDLDDMRRYISKRLNQACYTLVSVEGQEGPLVRVLKHTMGKVLRVEASKDASEEGMMVVREVVKSERDDDGNHRGQGLPFKYALRGRDQDYYVFLSSHRLPAPPQEDMEH